MCFFITLVVLVFIPLPAVCYTNKTFEDLQIPEVSIFGLGARFSTQFEQRFLSGMAFSIYKVVRIACYESRSLFANAKCHAREKPLLAG